jgi:hypothetical protein
LDAGRIRKKGYFWKRSMQEERDNWKEKQHTRACMEDLMMLGLGFFVIHCNGW